jgi:hypothetical protein
MKNKREPSTIPLTNTDNIVSREAQAREGEIPGSEEDKQQRERGNEEDREREIQERILSTSIVQSVELRSIVGHESITRSD